MPPQNVAADVLHEPPPSPPSPASLPFETILTVGQVFGICLTLANTDNDWLAALREYLPKRKLRRAAATATAAVADPGVVPGRLLDLTSAQEKKPEPEPELELDP